MKLLTGKTSIITGASRGIGKGVALVFAQHGSNIAFTYSSSFEAANQLEKVMPLILMLLKNLLIRFYKNLEQLMF